MSRLLAVAAGRWPVNSRQVKWTASTLSLGLLLLTFAAPHVDATEWRVGARTTLCAMTYIRHGSGNGYAIHTIVPANDWLVDVIGGPRTTDGQQWWDISRRGIDGGGTGWISRQQAEFACTLTPQSQPVSAPPQPVSVPAPAPVAQPQPAQPAPGGGTVALGQTVTGRIGPGGQDRWSLAGNPGERVRIEMSGFDTYLYLNDPTGARVASDDDSLGNYGSLIDTTLQRSGAYTIIAAGYGSNSGSYRLTTRLVSSAPAPVTQPQPSATTAFTRPTRGYLGACWNDPRVPSGGDPPTNHTGIDVWSNRDRQGPLRQPVFAVSDGVVRTASSPRIEIALDALPSSFAGRVPQLSGLAAYYTHLSEIHVAPGQRVTRGQQIGVQGDAGGNGIVHLHFSIKRSPGANELYIGNTLDPSSYLGFTLSSPSCGVNTGRWHEPF